MKEMVILSGKGGTGKTTITAALAHLAAQEWSLVLVDADVDAANLELVLAPVRQEEHPFTGGEIASIAPDECIACGRCAEVCRFDAIIPGDVYRVDTLACEGCASCFYQCPVEAIQMHDRESGRWFRSDTRFGPLFHAHLFAGQENSGKLVTTVKHQARLNAFDSGARLLLVDGPPGIGCPVISASTGADLALLVVEPTVSGAHDLERVLATTEHFGIAAVVAINKADLNPERAQEIAEFCAGRDIPVVGRIPYDTIVIQAMVAGEPVTAYANGTVTEQLRQIWTRVKEWLS